MAHAPAPQDAMLGHVCGQGLGPRKKLVDERDRVRLLHSQMPRPPQCVDVAVQGLDTFAKAGLQTQPAFSYAMTRTRQS